MKIKLKQKEVANPRPLLGLMKPALCSLLCSFPCLLLLLRGCPLNNRILSTFYNPITEEKMGRKLLKKGRTPDQFQTELYDTITKIETEVLHKIQKIKANYKSYLCQHLALDQHLCEPYDPAVNYYDKFWKKFFYNEIAKRNVGDLQDHLGTIKKRLLKIEALFGEREKQLEPLLRNRRKQARRIDQERLFCASCHRSYRDEETLLLHVKIKHRKDDNTQLKQENQDQPIFEEESEQ